MNNKKAFNVIFNANGFHFEPVYAGDL